MTIEVGRYLGQDGVWLKNDKTRLFVQKFGGMTPDFSRRIKIDDTEHWVNTHWNPHFKSPFSGKLNEYSEEERAYWGIELMRQAAGTFPCAPTFGPGNEELLSHGDTANFDWQLEQAQQVEASGKSAVYAQWQLSGNYKDLKYRKWDLLASSGSDHYMVLEVTNPNKESVLANLAWHTTLGSPFLERGCYIGNNCCQFKVAPLGTEFDSTSALEADREFTCMSKAPGANGQIRDLSSMPGYNGHAEFITGITRQNGYLWSVCVNPHLNLAYLTLIPFNAVTGQVNASSMNYWIHSGGRDFAPWADYQGGTDRNYALGMESSVGASCLGLDKSTESPIYFDRPSHCSIEPGQSVRFPCINTLFELDAQIFSEPLQPELVRQKLYQLVEVHISTLDLKFSAFRALTQKDN